MTGHSPSQDTFNTSCFPAIPEYNGFEQDSDGHNALETNLNVSALLLP